MQKICIIGSGGAGKSTLSNKLGKILNLPVYHLDRYFWKPGWQQLDRSEFKELNIDLTSRDKWIIDGNYRNSMQIRIEAADTIIFMDFPRRACIYYSIKRYFMYKGTNRPDMSEGCNERLEFKYYKWLWSYPKDFRPETIKSIERVKDKKKVIVLKNRKETGIFLNSLTNN